MPRPEQNTATPVALKVVHRTVYTYTAPVELTRHRLMLRPRDSHDLRLVSAGLRISPHATLHWHHDVFGNSIAYAYFVARTDRLEIESTLNLERYARAPTQWELHDTAQVFPPRLTSDVKRDLGALREMAYPGDRMAVERWLLRVLGLRRSASRIFRRPRREGDGTLEILRGLNTAIHDGFSYDAREAEGTQQPAETIQRGAGTCRDFAMLMMEATRALGFGARFVTGYLYSPATGDGIGQYTGAAASHAWADVYVPGAGWIEYDPTNALVASPDLIRVATVRAPHQAMPVSGNFTGDAASMLGVEVYVTPNEAPI